MAVAKRAKMRSNPSSRGKLAGRDNDVGIETAGKIIGRGIIEHFSGIEDNESAAQEYVYEPLGGTGDRNIGLKVEQKQTAIEVQS
jgi:hypothetical protein